MVDSQVWKEIIARRRSALAKGDLNVSGGRVAFGRFMKMFETE